MGRVINAASFPIEGMESAWESGGYYGAGNVVGLLDSLAGRAAIVCGGARNVYDDLDAAERSLRGVEPVYFAANDIGVYLPRVDHFVSLHDDNLAHWAALRADKHSREGFKTHSLQNADYNWEQVTPCLCVSGLFAMQVAYLMGAERVVLCGIPCDDTPRFFDGNKLWPALGAASNGIVEMLLSEIKRVPNLTERVRSMSGLTENLFGSL
jgi:hypothetical protein